MKSLTRKVTARRRVTLETDNGLVAADILADGVRLALPPPSDCRLNRILDLAGRSCRVHTIDTGVPHAVLEAEDLESADLAGLGPAIRHHPMFAPQGTNVNWMAFTGPDAIAVRTYERGVEAETPACGTGITACALIAARLGRAAPPVRARCRHGDTLIVNFRLSADGFEGLTLQGPAAFTSAGRLEL